MALVVNARGRGSRFPLLLRASLLVAIRTARGSSAGDAGRGHPHSLVKAVLFDFDGSLVQSEETHRLSFSAVLGRELDHETWYTKCVGRRPLSILQEYRQPDAPSAEELSEMLKADAVGRYDQVSPTVGHSQLLDDVERAGICMAIVSSGSRMYIERVLHNLELRDRFRLIVAGDDPQIEGRHKVSMGFEPRTPRLAAALSRVPLPSASACAPPAFSRIHTRTRSLPACSESIRSTVWRSRTRPLGSKARSGRACELSRCAIRPTAPCPSSRTRRSLPSSTISTTSRAR
jgi:phosphoglycolate phosphatase-like HAD superfamily hydrolase